MEHKNIENFLIIQNDLHNESVQDFANRLEKIHRSVSNYYTTHANILVNYIDNNFSELDELYPYVEYRGYTYSERELYSTKCEKLSLSMEEQITIARLEGTLRRPINLDAVDTFPFNTCGNQWTYISYKSNDHINKVGYDQSLFSRFLISIINHAGTGLIFSYSYTTYIGPSSYDHHSDTYIEYLLCFDKETNIRIVVESLRCDLFALGLIPSNIKILTKSEEIASFFKGDYLFEVYPGLHCFDSCSPRLFIFQVRYSVLEYYSFFSSFSNLPYYFTKNFSKMSLNEFISFDCNNSYQMPLAENLKYEFLSRIDPVLHKYLSGLTELLSNCCVFIPLEYKEKHVMDKDYTILNDYNNVNSFIQIYFKKSHEQ